MIRRKVGKFKRVLAGFINSQEFKNLCATYGINPGSIVY